MAAPRERKIYNLSPGAKWSSGEPFPQPMTFDTIALDPQLKDTIVHWLWLSAPELRGNQQIVIFTATERPSLLDSRDGFNVIELDYLRAPALAENYLGTNARNNPLAGELLGKLKMTPAEVCEVFTKSLNINRYE